MKKKIFAFALIGIMVFIGHSHSSAGDIPDVHKKDQPSSIAKVGQETKGPIIYKRNGRKLVCDRVWREESLIFLVVKGKRFAIGYRENEIDMKKSFQK